MDTVEIRMATLEDAQAINEIYEKYIMETAITFEYEPVPLEEFRGRMEKVLEKLPYLVCEIDGKIAGYAYVAPFKSRAAFAWDLEITVYLREDYFRRNIGRAFYEALFEISKKLGYVNIYALITEPNEKSKRMHEAMGFEQVGMYPNTGYKLGQWWGLNVMCKQLTSDIVTPNPTRSIHEIDTKELEDILRHVEKQVEV